MKSIGYYFFKYWVSVGLFFYYKKVIVKGLENIPNDKPVLFLSNHQNALLDVLLIATRCSRKPWFLARSDIFKNRFFRPLFVFLQMLPIYRIRDGKASLAKNEAIFNRCGDLLNNKEGLLIFPEANHNLKRRIRPLSKGFTRIIDKALLRNPENDVYLIPIGQNYQCPTEFGDSALLNFGKPIPVQNLLSTNHNDSVQNLKNAVSKELKKLTVHIENEKEYEVFIEQLDANNINYLHPKDINDYLDTTNSEINKLANHRGITLSRFSRLVCYLINLPIIFIWRVLVKPKVPEQEFMSTFRFGFAMVIYPIFYFFCWMSINYAFNIKTACLFVIGHAVLNLILIKIPLLVKG